MAYEVAIRDMPAQKLFAVRERARQSELGMKIGAGLDRVYAAANKLKLAPLGHNVVLYHNTAERNMRSEGGGDIDIGVLVTFDAPAEGDVRMVSIPAGRCLVTTHNGAYLGIPNAHGAVQTYAAANGIKITGLDWEEYGDVTDMSDPSKLTTDIYYLLA